MIITSVLSTESDTVTVTFEQDEVSETVKMTKKEYIDYVQGKK